MKITTILVSLIIGFIAGFLMIAAGNSSMYSEYSVRHTCERELGQYVDEGESVPGSFCSNLIHEIQTDPIL